MYTCANCTVLACANNEPEKMPKNCPMRNASVMEAARAGYDLPENHDFYVNCSAIEGLGYCQWPRLKETVEFCKRMGYHKLGLAFCKGLRKEARIVADLLRAQGFEVVSVICKTGGISKEEVGIPEEVKIHPGEFEAMCNPIAQAKLLNILSAGDRLHSLFPFMRTIWNRRSGSSRPKRSPRSSGPLSARCWQQPSRKPPSSRNVRRKKSSKGGWNDEA